MIETEKPNVKQIAELVNRVKEQVPNAKLVYNNSPSFNWTLKFREQVYAEWQNKVKTYLLTQVSMIIKH